MYRTISVPSHANNENYIMEYFFSNQIDFKDSGFLAYQNIQPKALYGNDDRREINQISLLDPQISKNAKSVCILFKKDWFDNIFYRQELPSFGTLRDGLEAQFGRHPLAPDVRFADQPVCGFGTGFLVGKDIVATARHCVGGAEITNMRFVFGFWVGGPTSADRRVTQHYYFRGQRVLAVSVGAQEDWALIRLDRETTSISPLKLATQESAVDDNLYVLGHPKGLPMKYGEGAVSKKEPDWYETSLPAFSGNSGSPVFNSSHEVVGIVVKGNPDYRFNSASGEIEAISYPQTDGAERVQKIGPVSSYLNPSNNP